MSFSARTDVARAALLNLQAGIHQAATLTLRGAVKAAEDNAKGTTLFRDRTGHTRSTIHGQILGARGTVEARGAAHWLENGTLPHMIVARQAKALHFFVNGREFFRRSVHHPGTKARPFMAEARERGIMAAEYGAEYYVGYAIQRASA